MSEKSFGRETEELLSPNELLARLRDPSFLPTHKQVLRAFSERQGEFLSLEWQKYFFETEHPVFELLNEEYLNALSDYLLQRLHDLSLEGKAIVLEVGAGSGRLAYFLTQKIQARSGGGVDIQIVATDSGEWSIKPDFPVEIMDQKKALEKYKPDLVISSWMPYQVDWTVEFRSCPTVQEYILIGEADGGCVGDEWLTWGRDWSFDDEEQGKIPPYQLEGFERLDLEEISENQICLTDSPNQYWHSSTVSFRRKRS